MSKTLLLLGGARYALPVIEAAHDLGVHVVTCDYLPDNFAHAYSDGYVNASIIENEAILKVAETVHADGIMAFAADPGVLAAAFAAEKLGLPFQASYEVASILQDKELFRAFLQEHDFNCPRSCILHSVEDADERSEMIEYPVIVKPVDSAGSKGCTRVDNAVDLKRATEYALQFSRDRRCIVEQFLEKRGDSSGADAFIVDGKFECVAFTSQLFDESAPNPYAPIAYTVPASMPAAYQTELKSELQRLADLLELGNGIYNIETRVAEDGKPYIMEVSPRGGGNRLSELLKYATGGKVDLVRASVEAALGMVIHNVAEPVYEGFWYQQMLHSERVGTFEGIEYAHGFRSAHVVEEQVWIEKGTSIDPLNGANNAFGSIILKFDTEEELKAFLRNPSASMRILVR